jgi:outer membrane protein insertion porin family
MYRRRAGYALFLDNSCPWFVPTSFGGYCPDPTMPVLRPRTLLLSAALLAAGTFPALAQPEPQPAPAQPEGVPKELEPFEGRLIRKVTMTTGAGAALAPTTEALARNQLRLKEGAPFAAGLVSDDLSRLNKLLQFRRVESSVQGLADGSVALIYTLEPQPLVAAVQTVGNRAFGDADLPVNPDVMVGSPIDPTQIDRVARSIESKYKAKGYYNALVTIDQQELEQSGVVLFRIREGERTKVQVVEFIGNLSFGDDELQGAIKTKPSWLIKRSPVDDDQLADDVATIVAWYRDRGYLDVGVSRTIRTSPDGKEAIVTFLIDEGTIYTLRNVQLIQPQEEVPVFTTQQLLGLMTIQPGDVYSDNKLKKSVEAIKDAYGQLGYADAEVIKRDNRDTVRPFVDSVIIIKQGRRWKTGLLEIQGNDITRDDVVRRTLTIQPDRPLDTTEIRRSESRLKQTNLFARNGVRTTIQPEDPDTPGYRDVLVEVEETNTGKLSFGGSVGSDGGLVGIISLQQNNFDVTDTPDTLGELIRGNAFRGGGQTFVLSALPGSVSNELSVSLSDPYVFGTDYTGSGKLRYWTRNYRSYDEQRVGANFGVGRRFGSRWRVEVPFRVEQVELTSIDPDAPTDYFDVEEARTLTAVGLTLGRSSYDNVHFPTKGNRVQLGVEQYFGESSFNKASAEYDTYIRLSEDVLGRSTVLRLSTSVKYIPQDQDEVPFYERFYLGGQNFRGFGYRGVSPVGIRNDNGELGDDPVGGVFSFFAGAEVRQPLFEDSVSVVGFVDTGTVDDELSFADYRVSVGVGLRIYVPQLSPVPLAFDFGFPVLKEETDRRRIFTFSVDVPFR